MFLLRNKKYLNKNVSLHYPQYLLLPGALYNTMFFDEWKHPCIVLPFFITRNNFYDSLIASLKDVVSAPDEKW